MKLAISTLCCPTWTLEQIISLTAAAGIRGVDFRGVGAEIDITRLPAFAVDLPSTLASLHAGGLSMPCLNTSVTLVTSEMPLLETHDDWSTSDEVLELLATFDPADVGVLWDIEHPYRKGEAPEKTARSLARLIRHTHVKDSLDVDGKNVPKLLGEGNLPIPACIAALRGDGYDGWACLETEKRWLFAAPLG